MCSGLLGVAVFLCWWAVMLYTSASIWSLAMSCLRRRGSQWGGVKARKSQGLELPVGGRPAAREQGVVRFRQRM